MILPRERVLQLKGLFSIILTFSTLALVTTNVYAEKGLFWKVESPAGKTSYLFGTMHTDDNRVTSFSPTVDNALQSVDAFMMETLASNNLNVFKMPDGDLKSMLNETELDKVYELAEFHVIHRDVAIHMKPWLLAMIFDSPKPLTPFAQDNLLMTKSEGFGKEVIGIEDAKEHFDVLDSFSRDEQLMMLRAVLKRSQKQKERDFESLMAAYLAEDSNKVAALDEKITGGMLPSALRAKIRSKLLDRRNEVMVQRILAEANKRSVFVAIGASHLAGKGGLITNLKEAGFKLSPIK